MPGYGSRCRSHCCDLQTGEIVSGDVECVATSAKRRSDGSVLGMAAMAIFQLQQLQALQLQQVA